MNPAGFWWAAAPEEEWPEEEELVSEIRSNFFGPHGDRHQELVFIGQGLDQHRIEEVLDSCLLTDCEFSQSLSDWSKFEDPLPAIELETEDAPE